MPLLPAALSVKRQRSMEMPLTAALPSSPSSSYHAADIADTHTTSVSNSRRGSVVTEEDIAADAAANHAGIMDIREHDDMIRGTLHTLHSSHAQAKNLFGLTITRSPAGRIKFVIQDEVRLGLWGIFLCMCLAMLIFLIIVAVKDDVQFSDTTTHPHGTALIIAGIFALLSCLITAYQVRMHLTHWTHPPSQKLVIRILMMVPVYSISSWLALLELEYSTYIDFVRVAYEAFTLYTFMVLLTQYLGGHAGVVEWMQYKQKIPWIIPLCCLPHCAPTSNFLWYLKYSCLQYAIFAPIGMLIAVICESTHNYGDGEFTVNQGYLWVTVLINTTQVISLYSLAWLYVIMRQELVPFNPVWKFLVVKSVVFFTFWQGVGLAMLVKLDVITDSENFSVGQVQVGLQDFITCIEMFIAACAHKYTFGHETYSDGSMALLMEQRATFIAGLAYKRAVEVARKELAERERTDAERATLTAAADAATEKQRGNGNSHGAAAHAPHAANHSLHKSDSDGVKGVSPSSSSSSFSSSHHSPPPSGGLHIPACVLVSQLPQEEKDEIIKQRVDEILRQNTVSEHVLFDDKAMRAALPTNSAEYDAEQEEIRRREPDVLIRVAGEAERDAIQMADGAALLHQHPEAARVLKKKKGKGAKARGVIQAHSQSRSELQSDAEGELGKSQHEQDMQVDLLDGDAGES